MNIHRSLKWLGAFSLGLTVLIVLVVALFDWNRLRGPIERKVTRDTGRTFAINGDLNVHLSLQPRIIANDIILGNAAWSREPVMAEIKRLDFRIDILQLLVGKMVFPDMTLSEPRVALEVSKDGTPNWVFKEHDKTRAVEFPTIAALTMDRGSASYRDPATHTDLTLDISTLAADKDNPESGLRVIGKGRFKGMPATIQARGGALLSLRSADHPYPIKASGNLGTINASIEGMLLDPLHLKGEQLNFKLEGGDLALLYPIIGVPLPPTPPFNLAGFLDHTGNLWTFRRFKGTVGQSDLAGEFAVDRGKHPQLITAELVSKKLVMKDLVGFIGADRGAPPSRASLPGERVLPTQPYSLEKLHAADAEVQFRAEQILTGQFPIEKASVRLTVHNGVLKLAPLAFGIAGGNLVSQIEMDGRKPRMATRADITAKSLHLGLLFPASKLAGADTGTMGGRAVLNGNGNSIAQMLGSANGEAALIMDGGSVSELMLRLSNLDIANSILVMLGGDKQIPIRCMVGNFKAVDGDFKVQALVLDTPKVSIIGSGNVNFTDESLHLRLASQGRGFSLASLRGPIAITGSFKTPVLRPEMGGVIARGGLALALGVATAGLGALIPLLDFGQSKDSPCAALVNQAKFNAGVKASDMAPQVGKSNGKRAGQ